MKKEIRTFARFGLVNTYLEIAVDSFKEYQKNIKELDLIVSEGGFWHEGIFVYNKMVDHSSCVNSLRKNTIKTIIFLTTFLDVYIYEFGGIVLGDRYTKEHLDKLDTLSKWIVIPKLITGKEINKSKSYFSDFKELIKWRNALIHHKSKDAIPFIVSEKKIERNDLKPIYEMVDITKFFKMLNELFIELDRIDDQGSHLSRVNMILKNMNS